jgi:cell division protein FtsL
MRPAPRLDETQPVVSPRPAATEMTTSSLAPRVSNAVLFTVVALAITTVGLLYLIQTAQVASLGYEVSRLERERASMSLANQHLTYEVARYESLPQVERVARDQLGMQPLDDYLFVTIPLPVADDLSLPDPEPRYQPSVAAHIWDRLTGQATASNQGGSEE